jgi:predicted transcriptional regulator
MYKPKLGEQESALLGWVASHAPASVAQVMKGFGAPNDLARTTVSTMLERLRSKGYVTREKQGSAFVYSPCDEHQVQLRSVVGRFIERTLGGSLDPFVAYLNETKLSTEQKDQLRAIVERLDDEPRSEKNHTEGQA